MSSNLTFNEAISLAQKGDVVYVVRRWMFHYYAMTARINGWTSYGPDHEPEIIVRFDDGEEQHVFCSQIYTDPRECQKEADVSQQKYGKVLIPQQEYDELKGIKKAYEAIMKGGSTC